MGVGTSVPVRSAISKVMPRRPGLSPCRCRVVLTFVPLGRRSTVFNSCSAGPALSLAKVVMEAMSSLSRWSGTLRGSGVGSSNDE
jgi:hypothetical protein